MTHAAHRPDRAPRSPWFAVALGVLASCASPSSVSDRREPVDTGGARLVGAEIDLPTRPDLLDVARLEAGRTTGGGRLLLLLRNGDIAVRERAATALGRLPFPRYGSEVTDALCTALADNAPEVRTASAFALGIRGDASAMGVLAAHATDSEANVRAAVVEAASRLGGPTAVDICIRAMADPSPGVRQEAIVGTGRWPREDPRGPEVDRRLIDLLSPMRTEAAGAPAPSETWLVLYALQRRRSPLGAGAFLDHLSAGNSADARIFAARGLARIDPSGANLGGDPRPELTRALERALDDPDWRVVVEAVQGLGSHGDPASIGPLITALSHSSAHVRRGAIRALGSVSAGQGPITSALSRAQSDISPNVRAEALETLAKVAPPSVAFETLQDLRADSEPIIRRGVARAAAQLAPEFAFRLLEPLAADPLTFVSVDALTSLGVVGDERSLRLLRATITRDPDLVLVQIAAAAIGDKATAEDVALMASRLSRASGDGVDELWNTALAMAQQVGGEGAVELAGQALTLANPYLRHVASGVLEVLAVDVRTPTVPVEGPPMDVPVAGRDFPLWRTNPLVEILTTRGSLIFELYPEEAPLHVHNFLRLAESGFYEGTTFHRVELDFVIQGGDARGDGSGGASWRGGPLPHEFTRRKYLRGSLGMPRWDDPDSGGSQIFVTHRPTPHLDGRYTLFGQLRQGWETLDRIEVGDRIRSVRVLP
ncbi:HEAT repeat domain-containing protein [Engelhardtia mirabilis]|uniref:peptidylprolyl isomerase n=1 Tax=Engelhardtia mirabilis TaxID=2528011 RepID=A0A518BSL4_9BACT|nr:putative peptidyl-prolyl cis-trans isomerase [Planctomycetes bacterium Pla133]QDV04285.1 putative peptidyl-prolyl cis-trans isomerase [Planctomycetes bacterium Pla86]